MDIGTAKPNAEEQERAPHFGLDLCDPNVPFSISDYINYRDWVLLEHLKGNKPVLVAGGSGFYLKSFFYPVVDQVEISEELQQQGEAIRLKDGLAGLMESLVRANPSSENFPGLDRDNPRRVEKALIRCLASGKSYSQLLAEFTALPEPLPEWDKEVWVVTRSQDSLRSRNENRVEGMLDAGLVNEVRQLRSMGFENNPSACKAIGYREVLEYLDGVIDFETLKQNVVIHTNQLMRKQRTWFRHQIPVDREIPS